MPPELPVNYGVPPKGIVVPAPSEGTNPTPAPVVVVPMGDLEDLIIKAVTDASQLAKDAVQIEQVLALSGARWKQLFLTLSQPRVASLILLLGGELFTRVTHIVVPTATIQNVLDLITMLSSLLVAYKSEKHSLV